jgi:hypothetical protein
MGADSIEVHTQMLAYSKQNKSCGRKYNWESILELNFMKMTKKRLFAGLGTVALAALIFTSSTPAGADIQVSLSGSAAGQVNFYTGTSSNATLTGGGSPTGASITAPASGTLASTNPSFTVAYGSLGTGDGTNEVAKIPLRVSSNTTAHVSASVASVTMTNLSYQGTDVSGSTLANATFIGLGNAAMTVAGLGNSSGGTYNTSIWPNSINAAPPYATGATLAALSSDPTAATGDTELCSFSKASSSGGAPASNYVEVYALMAAPTGVALGPTTPGTSGTFAAVVSFNAFTGT